MTAARRRTGAWLRTGAVCLALGLAGAPEAARPDSDPPRGAVPQASGDDALPRYRAALPPAVTLRYDVRHGLLRGTGELAWRPHGDRYELTLQARVAGLTVLTQTSSGAIEASGLAPRHHADQRLGRAATAADLDPVSRVISFADRSTRFEWHEGTQDRLSWMMQLAAIVSADARLREPGARVAMYVVGTHGDQDVWSLRCLGPDALSTRDGTVMALKYARQTRASGDTAVEIWLDPGEHHLPVRATQRSDGDDGFELLLRESVPLN